VPAAAPPAAAAATREASIALIDALSSKDEAAALALLQQAPASSRLAWVQDSRSGGYPAHVAAWYGLGQFIRQLVKMHGESQVKHSILRFPKLNCAWPAGTIPLPQVNQQKRIQHVRAVAAVP
jgi:hypothetical protein